MSDRPTPETDAVWAYKSRNIWADKSKNILEHARRLERERDEAREDCVKLAERLTALELSTAADLAALERERDEAWEKYATEATDHMLARDALKEWSGWCVEYMTERDEAREKLARIESLLLDPHAVYLNFLHGKIAKLDWEKLEHIHGPHPVRVERNETQARVEIITPQKNTPVAEFFSSPSTPETDAAVLASEGQWSFVLKETCQKLERERDEARGVLREIQAADWRTAGELRAMARRALEGTI